MAQYSEEQVWPGVREISVTHIEDYLAYLQERTRWFGERTYAEPKKLSKSHINVQYRRLHRFFNWLEEREYVDSNPFRLIKAPSLDEKTVPVVTEDQIRDLLTLSDPALARTPAHRFRLTRSRALLYMFWNTPGRLTEVSKLRLEDVDLETGVVLVMGKGRRERWMPLGSASKSVLSEPERRCCQAVSSKGLPRGKGETVLGYQRPVGIRTRKGVAARRYRPNPQALGKTCRHIQPAHPPVPTFLRG